MILSAGLIAALVVACVAAAIAITSLIPSLMYIVGATPHSHGAVTQITSKTTGVTLNKNRGLITTVALTDAADTSFNFVVTNSKISATSNVQVTASTAGTGIANAEVIALAAGSFTVRVANVGVAAFNNVVTVSFNKLS